MKSKIQKRSNRRISRRRKLQGGRPFDKVKIRRRIEMIIRDYLDSAIQIIDPITRTCAHEKENLITIRQSMKVVKEALSGSGGIIDLLENPLNKAKIQGRIKTIIHDYLDNAIKIIDPITRTCAHEKENLITVRQSMKVVKEALSGNGGISDLIDEP
jgi:hypothetical protein